MFDNITSSNGKIFRVTGPLCGEFTGHQKPVTRRFDVFVDLRLNARLSKQLRRDLRRRDTYYDVTVMNASDRKSVSIPLNYEKVHWICLSSRNYFSHSELIHCGF